MPSKVGMDSLHGPADGRAEVALSLACSAEAVRLNREANQLGEEMNGGC